jgi:hypothetical protein
MIRPVYETAKDRKIEQAIINELSDAWKVFYQKLPIKHRLDFALLDDRRNVTSWAEVKRRDNDSKTYNTYMLSLDKYMSGMKLFKLTGLPFFLIVKFTDGLYYCEMSLLSYAQMTISFGGRTDRADSQDVEPCVFFDTNLFKKVVSKE